mmetsp:Transcript_4712/g.13590  ORF Transcript_4712/g.13590 Transcript_4712/m.13590 type:complete len:240 (-) Transcript_4712:373-1092(-)
MVSITCAVMERFTSLPDASYTMRCSSRIAKNWMLPECSLTGRPLPNRTSIGLTCRTMSDVFSGLSAGDFVVVVVDDFFVFLVVAAFGFFLVVVAFVFLVVVVFAVFVAAVCAGWAGIGAGEDSIGCMPPISFAFGTAICGRESISRSNSSSTKLSSLPTTAEESLVYSSKTRRSIWRANMSSFKLPLPSIGKMDAGIPNCMSAYWTSVWDPKCVRYRTITSLWNFFCTPDKNAASAGSL